MELDDYGTIENMSWL